MATTMKKISTGNKRSKATRETINQYIFIADKPIFSVGKGQINENSQGLSRTITKHMTEHDAEKFKSSLPK